MRKGLKVVSLMLVLVLCVGCLFGCSGDKSNKQEANNDDKVYELRLSTVVNAPHPWIEMANYFSEEVAKKTNDKVKITVYPGGTLGKDETTIDEMRNGTIDFVLGGTQNAASFVPEYQVFSLAYLFNDADHFKKAIANDSAVFKRYQELYAEKNLNIRLLALAGGGCRNASNNLRPIVTPADLKGMKMRLPGSPMEAKLWSSLGALPTSLAWNEIYSAIQTGVVNAFESSISGYYGSKLYEVAQFHSETQHLFMLSHLSMSDSTYNKLPEKYRKVIEEVAVDAAKVGTEAGEKADIERLEELQKDFGVQVNKVDKEAFIQIVKPLHEELAEEIGASDILKMILDMK